MEFLKAVQRDNSNAINIKREKYFNKYSGEQKISFRLDNVIISRTIAAQVSIRILLVSRDQLK